MSLLGFLQPVDASGQIVLNEIRSDGGTGWTVELKNLGGSTVNIGGYFLCNYPLYAPLLSLDVECGSLLLEGGEIVVVSGFEGGSAADGEMGLYINGAFANPASIIDYVEWGSSGHERSAIAQAAGIWSAMDFVPGFSDGNSIEYSGSGNTSASWETETIVQSICAENPPGENCTLTAGTLSTSDPTEVCSGNDIPDLVDVTVTGASGNNSVWLITDTSGLILDVPDEPPFDFEDAGAGICLIWHVVYNGPLTGAETGQNAANLSGCYELSNAIVITREDIEGGSIFTSDPTVICAGDTIPDPISVDITDNTIGDQSAWVITDAFGLILDLPAGPPFDLNDAGPGVCRIWHMSYNDGLTGLMTGNSIDDLDGCYDLSNYIEVTRNEPDGGVIGTSDQEVCLVEANADTIYMTLTSERGSLSSWIVTDTNFVITRLQSGPEFTFSGDAGVCLIWHISYESGLSGLTVGSNALDISGCFDLSNAVAILKNKPEGGTISTSDNTVFCIDGLGGDTLNVSLSGASGENQQYVILDPDGDIVGLPGSGTISFDTYGAGLFEVLHVSFVDGLSGLVIGQPYGGLSGCFSASNSIFVERNLVTGGTISTNDETTLCLLAENEETIEVQLSGATGGNTAWVLTDTSGNILDLPEGPEFEFSGADGICLIWNITYTDGLSGLESGENVADLDGCFELSNAITVVKNLPDGGVLTAGGPTTFCNGAGGDSVVIGLSDDQGANGQWMILTIGGTILELPDAPPFNFDGFAPGTYVIYHLGFGDGLTGLSIGNTTADLVGCWDVSNPILITIQAAEGGTLSNISAAEICTSDEVQDAISATLNGASGDSMAWVITDTTGTILELHPPMLPILLEGDGPGACLLWNVSYYGALEGLETGSDITGLDGCFDLSNALVFEKVSQEGGTISTGSTLSVCASDTISGIVEVALSGADGDTSAWVITDADGTILELPAGPPFDFTMSGTGAWYINHMSFSADLTGLMIGGNIAGLNGCYGLSNTLAFFRSEPPVPATILFVSGGSADEICSGDGLEDTVRILKTGSSSMNEAWAVTDSDGEIVTVYSTAPPFYLEGLPGGIYNIRHVAYQGSLEGLVEGQDIAGLQGCFALSNVLTLFSLHVGGGTISTSDPTTLCLSDNIPDVVNVTLEGEETDENIDWLITDESGVILDIPARSPFEFDSTDEGTCLIWNISYVALAELEVGMNIDELFGCFDLSNPIEILKANSGPACETVGVQEQFSDLLEFDLFPNPAADVIRLEAVFADRQQDVSMRIYNSIGAEVMMQQFAQPVRIGLDISLQQLPAGQYFLKLETDGSGAVRPFVKQ